MLFKTDGEETALGWLVPMGVSRFDPTKDAFLSREHHRKYGVALPQILGTNSACPLCH